MGFLSPLFLLGALAAAVPIVLHLLRREPETRVRFAAVRLLEHAPVEHADKRRLRDLLLLALRVAALLLLALAFARPFVPTSAAAASGVTVVALDTSFSLAGADRFSRAQALARQAIADAPGDHRIAVVTFADSAQIVQPLTGDRALGVAAVNAAVVGLGATRYRAAIAAAADAVGARDGRIVVVTDLQASGWDAGQHVDLPGDVEVEVADVGPAPANLAVVAADVANGRLVATVRNSGDVARDVRLRVTVDGKPAGDTVHPVGARQSVDISAPVPEGDAATVAIDDPGGLPADDVRYVAMGAAARAPVLVVSNAGDLSREALYVEQALLAAGPTGPAYTITAVSGAQLSAWEADRVSRHAAVVVLSTRGLDQRGRELLAGFVRRGGGIFIAAGPDVDGDVAGAAIGSNVTFAASAPADAAAGRSLAPVDLRHPVFRAFADDAATLNLVRFRQHVAVRADDCLPLARFSNGEPALLECASGDGRVLLLASDLDGRWNDFPVHATFVPFLHEAIEYLGGSRGRRTSFVVGAVPADFPQGPGVHRRTAGTDSAAPDGVHTEPGVIAVNVDPRESDTARLTAAEFDAAVVPVAPSDAPASERAEARQQEERQNLWRYAILLMIAALMVESVLASRTA